MTQPTYININGNGVKKVTIRSDGLVEYHNDCTPDEGAKAFWEAVAIYHPYADEIRLLRDELAQYQPRDEVPDEDPISAYNRAMKVLGNRA
ncbi:MAG: hypothetical protein E4H14_03660 [Candidatus Thorarchaeota archaeon]|nr:MAG: hypothetical protein E4H14_03660 [Candidatus Thorarchaeota archaeon]